MVTTRSRSGATACTTPATAPAAAIEGGLGGNNNNIQLFARSKKKYTRRSRQSPTQLSPLLALPLDIWQQVATYLHADDLLYCSYTCIDMNNLLSSKRSERIWQNALISLDEAMSGAERLSAYYWYGYERLDVTLVTQAFSGMALFAIARYLLDGKCTYCSKKSRNLQVYPAAIMQSLLPVCMYCRRKELLTLADLQSILREEELPKNFWPAVPRAFIPCSATNGSYTFHVETAMHFLDQYRTYEAGASFDSKASSAWLEARFIKSEVPLKIFPVVQKWQSVYEQYARERVILAGQAKLRNAIERWNAEESVQIVTADIDIQEYNAKRSSASLARMAEEDWPAFRRYTLAETIPRALRRMSFENYLSSELAVDFSVTLRNELVAHSQAASKKVFFATWPNKCEFFQLPAVQLYIKANPIPTDPSNTTAWKEFDRKHSLSSKTATAILADMNAFQSKAEESLLLAIFGKRKAASKVISDLNSADVWVRCTRCSLVSSTNAFIEHSCMQRVDLTYAQRLYIEQSSDISELQKKSGNCRDFSTCAKASDHSSQARKLLQLIDKSGEDVPITWPKVGESQLRFTCQTQQAGIYRWSRTCGGTSLTFEQAVEHSLRPFKRLGDIDAGEEKSVSCPHDQFKVTKADDLSG